MLNMLSLAGKFCAAQRALVSSVKLGPSQQNFWLTSKLRGERKPPSEDIVKLSQYKFGRLSRNTNVLSRVDLVKGVSEDDDNRDRMKEGEKASPYKSGRDDGGTWSIDKGEYYR